jgi:hypothetical protein
LQPAFQNWLLKYLRIPTAVGEDQLALKLPPQKWVAENRKFNEYELRIAEILHRFPSVVIPAEKLAGYVLGDPLPEDWIEIMQEHAGSMREKVKPGVKIYRFEEIGWSIGWSNIGLGRLKLRALSELWENFNNGVDGKQVAKRLYGNANGRSVENAQAIIQTLKADLEETDYSIAFMHSLSKKSNFTPALIANHNIIGMDRKK